MKNEEIEKLAEDHWKYVESVLRLHGESDMVIAKIGFHYQAALIHGYKHGIEAVKGKE